MKHTTTNTYVIPPPGRDWRSPYQYQLQSPLGIYVRIHDRDARAPTEVPRLPST
jgi:hypothetical protein